LTHVRASRLPIRKKGATLSAVRVVTAGTLPLAAGTFAQVKPGDWRIMSGPLTLEVLTEADFPGPYEIVAEGTLVLTAHERELIELTAGIGVCRTGPALIHAVQRLARIGIGDVQIPFTPGQLEEIAYRAKKRGITVDRAILDVVDRIKGELFHTA
jgi:hypothetical protein